MKVNLRFCSSSSESKYGKSNANFTSFTTKASGFKDFEKTPSLRVIASIIINGASIPPNSKLFLERLDATELIEGSLHAVEAVTQAISSETYGFSESTLNRAILHKDFFSEQPIVCSEKVLTSDRFSV